VTTSVDLELLASKCYTAVFSDSCDRLNFRNQTLGPGIVPQTVHSVVVVGWARVVRWECVSDIPEEPYASEIRFLDSLSSGEVVVGTAEGLPAALWGELFSAAAIARGARGAVIDGLIRDRERVSALGFPVFSIGARPTDSLGRVSLVDTERSIEIRGVLVSDGDLVIADADGVVIVPSDVAEEVATVALEKANMERRGLSLLQEGAFLSDVWNTYKVL